MYIIAGLGNPGKEYENTRHNIGFDVIDRLSEEENIAVMESKHKALIGKGYVAGQKVILAKPQTFMNLSGESIGGLVDYFKIDEEQDLIVIYDDISLSPGQIRIRKKGSAGGHNGLKSIIYRLNSDTFPRVKMGVGAPKHEDYDLADFVLGRFTKEEIPVMEDAIVKAEKAVAEIIKNGVQSAMNKYNGK